jgi:hypothetical protein
MRDSRLAALPAADFLPVHVAQATTVPMQRSASIQPSAETIEIELPDGCRLRVGNAVDLPTLRRVLAVLRG